MSKSIVESRKRFKQQIYYTNQYVQPNTINGMVMWLDAGITNTVISNGAAQFSGTSKSILSIPASGASSLSVGATSFALQYWHQFQNSANAFQYLIGQGGHPATTKGWGAAFTRSGFRSQFVVSNGTGQTLYTASGVTLLLNKWNHIVVNVNRASNYLEMYVNNTRASSTSIAVFSGVDLNNSVTFSIGSPALGVSNFFQGRLDSIGLWTRNLSSEEISDLYNSAQGRVYNQLSATLTNGLISWWDLDEKTSEAKMDQVSGNTLQLSPLTLQRPTLIDGLPTGVATPGDPVLSWLDQSGLGNDAVMPSGSATTTRPILGVTGTVRMLQFDGVDDKIGMDETAQAIAGVSNMFTMFMYMSPITFPAQQSYFYGFYPGGVTGYIGSGNIVFSGNKWMSKKSNASGSVATLVSSFGATLNTNMMLLSWTCNGSNLTSRVMSIDSATGGFTTTPLGVTKGLFGAFINNASVYSLFANMNVGEVLVYNRPLDAIETQTVEQYFAIKYGLNYGQ